jgi:hypothetical protein
VTATSPAVRAAHHRTPDRLAAALAGGFVVLLLATEAVLTLPAESDPASRVATFYASHRAFILILQVLGFVAALLLGGYAWRLRRVDRVVSVAGMIMAVCSLVPGLITVVIAVVADPNHPASAGRWNLLEPRGDDVLFVGVVVFATAVALRLGRRLPALGVLALVVAVACLTRLLVELVGVDRGPLDAVGPVLFLVLIAVMAVLSFRGILRTDSYSESS